MDFNEYQKEAARVGGFGKNWKNDFSPPSSVLLGLSCEAGEIQDLYKKRMERRIPIDREELVKELGDLLWYLSTLAYHEGIPLEAVARANIWKLEDKYQCK